MNDSTSTIDAQRASVEQRIEQTLLADRHSLHRALKTVRRLEREGRPFDRTLRKLTAQLEKSQQIVEQRRSRAPKVTYDDALPITAHVAEVMEAIRDHQVVIVCGETGSGKSTQLPKVCLDAGRGIYGTIGHTQPRRIAARSVARRIAEELGRKLGDAVGFKIRFTDVTSPGTSIKLMTDGILLAETQSDRFLEQYDTIIIDEAHERSLNIDFLLGYIKRLLPRRPELRLIITSATIDAARFAEFFGDADRPAPVIEVSGRTYPVEVRYRDPQLNEEDDGEIDWQRLAADACEELAAEGPGDILVFMPTERDIRETTRVLNGRIFAGDSPGRTTEILPLFGRLSEKDQNRVFLPHSHRRIVVATNVAESSLTVPGIRYVVDPGTARISRYSPGSKVQRLPVEPISQASADQRKGRCGRIGPGICIRLYTDSDYLGRDRFTPPEIQRTNLASVLLQMKALKLGDIGDFPFLDPPNAAAIRSGLKTLFELGALDEREELTEIGRKLSRLPVDPRIGRMVLAAADEQCLEEVLIIASVLELRDPRERPIDKQQVADAAHEKLAHEHSDFLTFLKLWDFFAALDEKLSQSKLRKACHTNFLSFNRMREWRDLHRQLRETVLDSGLKPTPRRDNEEAIHRAILTGLLSNVAMKGDAHEYQGAGGQTLYLWPGSVAFGSKPKWIMAAELVETTKRFARTVAPIQPIWIERLAGHLVKRTYSEPHWRRESGAVMACEKVLLFGLPIVPRRRCRYGPIDPALSRTLFIQHALIEGDYDSPGEFAKHNAALKEELKEWQAKLRQGNLFTSEETEFRFYDQRLPEDAYDGPRFEKWRNQAEALHPKLLFLSKADLLVDPDAAPAENAFPDSIRMGTMDLQVEYHLEPGSEEDGATLIVPQEGLHQVDPVRLRWLVPGMLEETVVALIKSLPKDLRSRCVPIPDTVREIKPQLRFGHGDLLEQLSAILRRQIGEYVPRDAFDLSRVPDYLRFNIRVVGDDGKPLAIGRDLNELRERIGRASAAVLQLSGDTRWNQDGMTDWTFGELPSEVIVERGGTKVKAFPMLVDAGKGVNLRLSDALQHAQYCTQRALVRLFLLSDGKRIEEQVRWLPQLDRLSLLASPLPDGKLFRRQLAWRIAERALAKEGSLPQCEADWRQLLKQARSSLGLAAQDVAELLPQLLEGYHDVRRLVQRQHPPALQPLASDLKTQFDALFVPGLLILVPWEWLQQIPRYLKAMELRWQKATTGGFQKDRQNQRIVERYWQVYLKLSQSKNERARDAGSLTLLRWMIEEYRVATFAQQLGTALNISEKRLNELTDSLRRSG